MHLQVSQLQPKLSSSGKFIIEPITYQLEDKKEMDHIMA